MLITEAPFSTATLESYRPLLPPGTLSRLRRQAADLAGLRVLHINATMVGGGVAEMLLSLIPLMRDAGLDVDWYVIDGSDDFFEVTKSLHNGLQGQRVPWARRRLQTYLDGTAHNARRLAPLLPDYDVVLVHDPQPLALPTMVDAQCRWIWRCHIDMTRPDDRVWRALAAFLDPYDAAIFSTRDYVPACLAPGLARIAMPAIDPFRVKNADIPGADVAGVLRQHGIDPLRPYILQVSRYDPWKDPLGVLEVYRRLKRERPELQLVYMASMASDDPEGWRIYDAVKEAAGDDPDAHLLALDVPIDGIERNAFEVNAVQRGAAVVLQKSLREGFGLTVTEALWKGKPVVAGDVGGIRHQIRDGRNGFLVDSVDACADRVRQLLDDPGLAERFGRAGRETVGERFLMTRLLEQYLDLMAEVTGPPLPLPAPIAAAGGD